MFLPLVACGRLGFSGTQDVSGDAGSADALNASSDADRLTVDGLVVPSTWQVAPAPPPTASNLWGAYAFSANDLWVAGTNGSILHFTGTWTTTASSTTNTLFMFAGAATDLWLVGRSCTALRWMGASWAATTIPGCAGNQDFLSINGTATTNIWATGIQGNIEQWSGSWTDRSSSNVDYWDAEVTSATDVVAVGTLGAIVHWNGSAYATEASGTGVTLAAITRSAPGEYWVVGGSGTILHKVGAGTWTAVSSPTGAFLYDVVAVSATDLWAVGSAGVILHGDGASWVQVASPTAQTLRNLELVPGGGIMAAGDAGTLLLHP